MKNKKQLIRNMAPWLVGTIIGFSGGNQGNIPAHTIVYQNQIKTLSTSANPTKTKSIDYIINLEFLSKQDTEEDIGYIYRKKEPSIIDEDFVRLIIQLESNGNYYAVSQKGASGLMQLMPVAWKEVDDSDFYKHRFNPEKNREVGEKYLRWIENYCEKNYAEWNILSVGKKKEIIGAAYNGGISRLEKKRWNIAKMPPETRRYVQKIEEEINNPI